MPHKERYARLKAANPEKLKQDQRAARERRRERRIAQGLIKPRTKTTPEKRAQWKEGARRWALENPTRSAEHKKTYRERNVEKCRAASRAQRTKPFNRAKSNLEKKTGIPKRLIPRELVEVEMARLEVVRALAKRALDTSPRP